MHVQTQERERRLLQAVPTAAPACEAVAVASGAGNRRLFESLGARVVDGGRTMNPSTADILAAVEASPADEVVLLPNDKNVLMSAEQASAHASKPVHVVPAARSRPGSRRWSRSTRRAWPRERGGDARRARFGRDRRGHGRLARRRLERRRRPQGIWLGLAGGEPVASGESFDDVARVVLARLLDEPRGVLTLLTGEEPPALELLLAELESSHPGLELEVHDGGQPHYALLLSAE